MPQTQLIHDALPNPSVILQNFWLTDDGDVVWSATKANAAVPGMFGTDDLVILGWFVMRAADVAHTLQYGSWPVGAEKRPEPYVNSFYVFKSSTLMDQNNRRRELNAAERNAA